MRRALLACCAAFVANAVQAEVTGARLTQTTDRYDHGILGDALEWGGLRIETALGAVEVTLPQTRVFEDVEARVADLDGDGAAEVLVVETDMARGASLAVYDAKGKVTATRYIGRTHRWLAPLGVGDLDGDGLPEIAYVDRPHLAKELVIVQYRGRKLAQVGRISGLTNHRIGDKTIAGGLRNCGQGGEAILANSDWTKVMAVRLQSQSLKARALGAYSQRNIDRALACQL
ncbi:MAG: VCBS repeat-containing protein [Pseudorhodobacter sp.]